MELGNADLPRKEKKTRRDYLIFLRCQSVINHQKLSFSVRLTKTELLMNLIFRRIFSAMIQRTSFLSLSLSDIATLHFIFINQLPFVYCQRSSPLISC